MTIPGGSNSEFGQQPTDFTSEAGGRGPTGPVRLGVSRAKMAREARRRQQFAKFKNIELNLVPLVDTFVSIVFFALTTATVGIMSPVAAGVNLPESGVGNSALQQLTVGIGGNLTVAGQTVLPTSQAAALRSNDPAQPLLIPPLFAVLKQKADSIRSADNVPQNESLRVPLAVQGDRTMRYDLLSRVLQTARMAGFRNISLQVKHSNPEGAGDAAPAQAS